MGSCFACGDCSGGGNGGPLRLSTDIASLPADSGRNSLERFVPGSEAARGVGGKLDAGLLGPPVSGPLVCAEHPRIVDDEFKGLIYEMARQSVKLEDNFVDLAYKLGDIEGLDSKEVKEYIRYITDRRLLQLGLKGNYKVKDNPLPWLEWVLNGADHTNFFENRVTEYEVAGLSGKWDDVYEAA